MEVTKWLKPATVFILQHGISRVSHGLHPLPTSERGIFRSGSAGPGAVHRAAFDKGLGPRTPPPSTPAVPTSIGSHLIQRWREMDSNFWSHLQRGQP